MNTIYSRRGFLQSTALVAAAVSIPEWLLAEKPQNIGLQLYTLRNDIDIDALSTIKAVAKQGYKIVEGYANKKGHFFGYQPNEFASILKDLGLKMPSTHIITGRKQPEVKGSMYNGWEKMIEDSKIVGCDYLVCPWIHPEEYKTLDEVYELCDFFNTKAEQAQKAGLKFAYHNHEFEFRNEFIGKKVYEILLERCDPKLVQFEMDLYWVTKGDQNPLKYFEKYPGRFVMWHVKDMDKSDRSLNAEVGSGQIDFKPIFAKAKQSGMKYFYVEQETYKMKPLESTKVSIDYLKKMEF